MKFYVSTAFLDIKDVVDIAKAADDLGYDGMGIPDHVINLETLETPYPYTKDGSRRWEAFTHWPDPWVVIGAIALVLLVSPQSKTLPVGLLAFQGQYSTDLGVQAAGLFLAALPMVVLYFVFSRRITEGIATGALK